VLTRFLSIYPMLYGLGNGNRVSLLASINLSQISEFALVIVVIGFKPENSHIGRDIVTIVIFVFVLTSIASTYMIKYNQDLQNVLRGGLEKVGLRSLGQVAREDQEGPPPEIALLGFYRVASAFISEMENLMEHLKEKLVVVDFNPEVFRELKRRGIKVVYGDISNEQTLHHAGIEEAKVVVSTITDDILVGTSNLNLIRQVRRLAPQARIVVTAVSRTQALKLFEAGADYVLRPNYLTAGHLLDVLDHLLREETTDWAKAEMERLRQEQEVLA
jgi:ActR/RegA family two-component response regulator